MKKYKIDELINLARKRDEQALQAFSMLGCKNIKVLKNSENLNYSDICKKMIELGAIKLYQELYVENAENWGFFFCLPSICEAVEWEKEKLEVVVRDHWNGKFTDAYLKALEKYYLDEKSLEEEPKAPLESGVAMYLSFVSEHLDHSKKLINKRVVKLIRKIIFTQMKKKKEISQNFIFFLSNTLAKLSEEEEFLNVVTKDIIGKENGKSEGRLLVEELIKVANYSEKTRESSDLQQSIFIIIFQFLSTEISDDSTETLDPINTIHRRSTSSLPILETLYLHNYLDIISSPVFLTCLTHLVHVDLSKQFCYVVYVLEIFVEKKKLENQNDRSIKSLKFTKELMVQLFNLAFSHEDFIRNIAIVTFMTLLSRYKVLKFIKKKMKTILSVENIEKLKKDIENEEMKKFCSCVVRNLKFKSNEENEKLRCDWCKKSRNDVKLRYCENCSVVAYCSRECQVKDWKKQHKKKCFDAGVTEIIRKQRLLNQYMSSYYVNNSEFLNAIKEEVERLEIKEVDGLMVTFNFRDEFLGIKKSMNLYTNKQFFSEIIKMYPFCIKSFQCLLENYSLKGKKVSQSLEFVKKMGGTQINFVFLNHKNEIIITNNTVVANLFK